MSENATPQLTEYARRLLAFEMAEGKTNAAKARAAFRVCEKLRESLGRLMGVDSYRALLSRALASAGSEVPGLQALQITMYGSLVGWDKLAAKLNPRTMAGGEVVLVSHLLELFSTFIGTALMQRLLDDIWPEIEELHV